MSCEFVVVPAAAVGEPNVAGSWIEANAGRPPAAELSGILAGLRRWNTEIPVWNGRLEITAEGDGVRVVVPDHAVGRAIRWIWTVIADTAFTLYDPRDNSLGFPETRDDVVVDIGGELRFEQLTKSELHSWVLRLDEMASTPFLIVDREDGFGFIQTYRNGADDYTLEWSKGAPDEIPLGTELSDATLVTDLIWDWINDDWEGLRRLRWKPSY